MMTARARAALACVSIGAVGAVDGRPDICASRPIGTTRTPPSTTGGSGEICASSFSSSSRFCSRACRRSARLRASPELSRALGLPGLLLELELCGAVVPVRDFLGEPILHRRLGLGDQRELRPSDVRQMLRHDVRDGVALSACSSSRVIHAHSGRSRIALDVRLVSASGR